MSTPALVAKSDLLKQMPSCSYTNPPDLDAFSWSRIFEIVAAGLPLRKALEFKTLHSEAYHAVNRAFRKVTKLKIEVLQKKTSGENKEPTMYTVQGSSTPNPETAIEMVRYVLTHAKMIRQLDIYFEDHDLTVFNQLMDVVIQSENVQLESFLVKRRHAGQSVVKIGDVIRANASTLREVSRIGITEAAYGFNDEINLDRFGCMVFDLGYQPLPNQILLNMIRITESGAKFKMFSYTSFSGYDPTDEIVQNLLDNAQVEEIKLTMMNPPQIAPRPGYMIGKVRSVKSIILVEVVPGPRRFNRMYASRDIFEKVFPNCHHNIQFLHQF
ncbi:unnamed protein product [Caenorhabditis sp. 36 PRJEB53466]|nr:unnamed protein product [Caenorhabditis sp. 36 PRJEB53466]